MKNITTANSFIEHSDSFNSYCKMIRKYPTLSAAEEANLFAQIQKGDKKALDKLICSNLRFVITVAKKYQNQGLDPMDLIAEGNLGLVQAVKNYDPSQGKKFISYAVYYIQRNIFDAIAKNGSTIRKSDTHIRCIAKINAAIAEFEQKNERTPSAEEIAEITGIKASDITLFIGQNYDAVSGDEPINEDGEGIFDIHLDEDAEETDDYAEVSLRAECVRKALNKLSLRDNQIMCKYFGIGCEKMNLNEIGEYYHITHEAVRQIKNKCLKILGKDVVLQRLAYAG